MKVSTLQGPLTPSASFQAGKFRRARFSAKLEMPQRTRDDSKLCRLQKVVQGQPGPRSQALVVEHRPKGTSDLYHVFLSPQHGAYVFVSGRRLIAEAIRLAGVVPDSLHLLA